jgi:ribosomal-protein-alanine N-acetyltransferase
MATAPDWVPAVHVTIRPMTDGDVPSVVGIERECLRVGYVCRAAITDDELVGYGVMSAGAGEAHILNLCVAAAARCRGVGRTLLGYLLDRAAAAGMGEAYLEVRPSNAAAMRLYHSLGFEQVGTRRGYYQAIGGREDACVLKLPLRGRRARAS